MSLYVLDTDVLSLYQRGHPGLSARVQSHELTELAITVISLEEQLTGWYTLLRQARQPEQTIVAYQSLVDSVLFLTQFRILSFSKAALDRFDELVGQKLNIGRMDLRIAAITLANGGTLVTRNVRDFQRVPGLSIEDWTT